MNPNWLKLARTKNLFFAYSRSKSKSKVKLGSLEDSQGELSSESKVKAEMLNDFFSTVFTREDEKDTPVLNPLCDAKLVDIGVSVDIITLRAKLSGTVYCNQSCLWMCLWWAVWVCYHDNSKLCASIFTKLGHQTV